MYELVKQKNEDIARMMWKLIPGDMYFQWVKDDKEQTKIACFQKLKFHCDANWQFEAIEFIEKLGFFTEISGSSMSDNHYCWFMSSANFAKLPSIGYNGKDTESKKQVIFQALHNFSEYLKKENENKDKN